MGRDVGFDWRILFCLGALGDLGAFRALQIPLTRNKMCIKVSAHRGDDFDRHPENFSHWCSECLSQNTPRKRGR
jgi:hypothetical protein